ncbi:MAG: hemerythrin domain-containing protein [Candidatus Omnitrophica bacterium]|nr:hemerythrin domain-containing protein [Candidatus Omnitrophota bacterium]
MLPIGLLMIEHRLIERMLKLLEVEISDSRSGKAIDMIFFEAAIDFLSSYADRCHHGKEEDVLFRDLDKKEISGSHREIMQSLVTEHIYGRKILNSLVEAKERYLDGENSGLMGIIKFAEEMINFYPKHIEKEDRHFFIPIMEYFTKEEKNKMIDEFFKFDQALIHEKYKGIVESWENRKK